MAGHGYKEIMRALLGEYSLGEGIELLKKIVSVTAAGIPSSSRTKGVVRALERPNIRCSARPSRSGCSRGFLWAGSLLGR